MNVLPLRRALVATALSAAMVLAPMAAHASTTSAVHTSVEAVVLKAKIKHFSKAPKPQVSGASVVGGVLKASPGKWKPKPSFSYRWRVDGFTVPGATQSRYTVRAQDAGSRITVVVRAAKRGYSAKERTSASVQIPAAAPVPVPSSPAPAPAPSIPAPAPAPSTPAPAPSTPAPLPQPSNTAISGDGDYRVGINLLPGVYVTSTSTSSCYWERVRSFDGSTSSIIANDLGSGQRIVTVRATDYGVSFSRCGTWVREVDAPAADRIATGQYLVGSQMPTGLYMASPSASGCYWALLRDFDGSVSSIISNDFRSQTGPVYVQVGSAVRGFESSSCGTWTRVSS